MKKIGLFYWAKGGNVESVAKRLSKHFNPDQLKMTPLDELQNVKVEEFDFFVLGGSTVGASIWQNADDNNYWRIFFDALANLKPLNKLYAIFGLGDQVLYPNHFVDGMNVIRNEMDALGGKRVGNWPVDGYKFTESESVENGKFIGLALDEDWQDDLTDERIKNWAGQIKMEFGL